MRSTWNAQTRVPRAIAALTALAVILAVILAAPPGAPIGGTSAQAATIAAAAPPPPPSTVTLAIDRSVISAGESATLTATVDQPLEASASVLTIWDLTTNTAVRSCSSGLTCTSTTIFYTGGGHTFEARVNALVSNPQTLTRAAWSVSLSVDKSVFSAGESVTLTATANQSVGSTNSSYRMWIKDLTTGTIIGTCTSPVSTPAGFTCTTTTNFYVGDVHRYQAYIANFSNHTVDIQATSNEVTAQRAAWSVSLSVDKSVFSAGESVTLTATANQSVGSTNSSYRMWIKDLTTGTIIGTCTSPVSTPAGFTCTTTTSAPLGRAHRYVALVSNFTNHQLDVQATSNGFSAPNAGGPTLAGETAGGSNPSEDCSHRCHGDPVNSTTGEFWETSTDIAIPGLGTGLAWSRSFGTTRAAVDGPMGFGWSHGYGMSLQAQGGTVLASAPWVDVLQENGSVVTFTADGAGGYSAPLRVKATLELLTDGSFRFVRQQRQTFTFNPAGRLTSLSDLNGNVTSLTYTGVQLDRVANASGQFLTLQWAQGRIVSVTDQTARTVQYTYSSAGDLTGVRLPDGSTKSYAYDSSHRVLSLTHADGGVTRNAYDTSSRVVSQTDPLGRVTTFVYGAGQTTVTDPTGAVTVERFTDGRVLSETKAAGTALAATTQFTYTPGNQVQTTTDPLGRVTTFAYDAIGNRTSTTDPLGRVSTTTYDAFNSPLVITNASGQRTTLVYDARGNLTSSTAPDGAVMTYTVNPNGTVASVTDALGRITSLTYDARGFVAATTAPDGTKVTTAYDSRGNRLSVTSPLGNVAGAVAAAHTSRSTFDEMGRPLTETDPLGAVTAVLYDRAGRVRSATDATGRATSSTYDLAGQLVSTTDAAGRITRLEYDGAGRVIKVTDPAGAVTRTAYDVLGRVTSRTDPTGRVSRLEYDAGDRVTAAVDPSGDRTTFSYDAADQLLSTTNPLGHATTTTYDPVGRPVKVTDADGRHVTTSYDRAGRMVRVLRGDGSDLTWQYDVVGQLTRTTDAAGRAATSTWDTVGRQATYTDTAGRLSTYGYDADGRMTTLTQPDGAVTTFTYDTAGRRTGTDYSDSTPDVSTTYDAAGRVSRVLDGTGTVTYSRDVLGRVTTVDRAGTVVGYGYDTAGRVDTLTYPSGQQVRRNYDPAGRLTAVTDWAARTYTYAYDTDGAVNQLRYPNGVTTSYTADAAGQTLAVSSQSGTGTTSRQLLDLAYGYTPAGLLANQSVTRPGDPLNPPTSGTTTASTYTWDALSRLAQVTGADAGPVTYDTAGSVTSLTDGRTLTYDTNRQVTALADPAAGTTSSYGFDTRGNRTTGTTTSTGGAGAGQPGSATHTFDQANRLTTLTTSGAPTSTATTSYTYDANGLRASATTGALTERFVWDAMSEAAQLLRDGEHSYVYGLGPAPLAQVKGTGAVDYLHTDLLGSVRATSNAIADVTATTDYDPYGRVLARPTTTPTSAVTRFGYAGEYTDPGGYIYLRNRYYDPTSAQFLSLDPLLQTTGDPYAYTAGNPLQFTDPLGLSWWDPTSYDANTWDNISLGLGVAAVIVAATGFGAPVALALGGLAMAANGAAMYRNYEAGNCVGAAIGIAGFIPGVGKVGGRLGAEAAEAAAKRGARVAAEEGLAGTPAGRPFSAHYLNQTGPKRNIPGGVVDDAIDNGDVVKDLANRTVYYDPKNDVTVVVSKTTGKIMSARRGRP